jgi:hypothetical protein
MIEIKQKKYGEWTDEEKEELKNGISESEHGKGL